MDRVSDIAVTGRKRRRRNFRGMHWLLTLLLTVLVMVASAVVDFSQPLPPWRLPAAAAVIGSILILGRFQMGRFSTKTMVMLFLWCGYGTMSVVSAIVSHDNISGELWQLLGAPIAFFFVIPHYAKEKGIFIVALAIVFGFLPFLLVSLATQPLGPNYTGVFANPNAIGMMAETWLVGLLIIARGYVVNQKSGIPKYFITFFLGLAFILSFILIIASSSRTSLITAVIAILIFIWSLCLEISKHRSLVRTLLTVLVFLAFISILASQFYGDVLFTEQAKKFNSNLGLFSGRDVIWQTVIEETSVVGYGDANLENRLGEPAHNLYLEVLHSKGLIGMVFRFFFDLMAIILSYRLAISKIKEDSYAIGPFIIIMNYMLMGIVENVNGTFGSGIHITFLLMVGMMLNYNFASEL